MSLVTVEPELLTAAAIGLQAIGTELNLVNTGGAGATTMVLPAAADDVSALAATRFSAHGQQYQTVAAQAAAIHQEFVAMLQASAASYALAEATNQALAS